MGQRGPTPQPSALRIVRGNPGKRPINPEEPTPDVKEPHCPAYLDTLAKKEWKRLIPILLRMRVLTEADYLSLADLCQSYSTMVQAQDQLSKSGLLMRTKTGYIQQSPLLGIVNRCADRVGKLCREFGLTPSSRTRVQAVPDETKKDNPWENLKRTS